MSATELFIAKAQVVSAQVINVDSMRSALQSITGLFEDEGITDTPGHYALWAIDGINAPDMAGVKTTFDPEMANQSSVGVTMAEWGIAETGTVAHNATSIQSRLASTLSELHVVILNSQNIVPDLESMFEILDPDVAPYLAFITGPSRTADIERVLTIGVHGPKRLVIILVDGTDEK
jgi:L-lactate dehydrogenase complex protein LldG